MSQPFNRAAVPHPGSPPALLRRYPAVAERVLWQPLGQFPTPVQTLALEGTDARVWVKRDDLAGRVYGGNKVRKLEFLLAQARHAGAQRLLTIGAAGSHHSLATAAYGTALGFGVTLVLFPQPLTEHVRRVLLLDHALGAELRYAPRMASIPATLLAARLAHRAERCFLVPPGGSDPVGTLGYVSAALELAEQIEDGAAPQPTVVHVAAGTLGTTAGLALGFALAGLPVRVRAVRITSRLMTNRWRLRRLISRTTELLRRCGVAAPSAERVMRHVELCHDQIGDGYGRATPGGREAQAQMERSGLSLDGTYTAKAAAAVLRAAEREPGSAHLFWHTLSACQPTPPPQAPGPETLPSALRRYLAGPVG